MAVDSLRGLDSIAPPPGERGIVELIQGAVAQQRLRTGAFQRHSVAVMDVMQARGLRFSRVFLVGMGEHVFPMQARQDPLLLDRERRVLNRRLGEEPPALALTSRRSSEEELLFALAVEVAQDRLVLSFPRIDGSGRQKLPSQFLLRFLGELRGERLTYQSLRELPEYSRVALRRPADGAAQVPLDMSEWDLAHVLQARERGDVGSILSLASEVKPLGRSLMMREAQWGRRELTAYDGYLRSPPVRDRLINHHRLREQKLSPSRIEAYATCPYKYYLRNVLGVRRTDEPEEVPELSPLDRGTLYHAVLERFYRARADAGELPLRRDKFDDYVCALEAAARDVFRETERDASVGHALMWDLQQETVLEELRRFLFRELEREEGWQPVAFELEFGVDSPVELPGAGVRFRGRMDRLDLARSGRKARVTDYKAGRLSYYKNNDIKGGETIQLPVYVLAASQYLGVPPEDVTARYASVSRRGGFGEVSFEGENWEQTAGLLDEVVGVVERGIQKGRFFARPGRAKTNCRTCDYGLICPTAIETLANRKSGDAAMTDYLRMKGES